MALLSSLEDFLLFDDDDLRLGDCGLLLADVDLRLGEGDLLPRPRASVRCLRLFQSLSLVLTTLDLTLLSPLLLRLLDSLMELVLGGDICSEKSIEQCNNDKRFNRTS